MSIGNQTDSVLKKSSKQAFFSSYSREISLALLVKFLLLGGIWWLFFFGNKQPVDEALIADKIYGVMDPVFISNEKKERLK